jgi:hypothetical protein
VTLNVLYLKKLLIAFALGFAYVIVQKLTNVGAYAAFSSVHALWTGLLSGAVTAGFRALLVLLPVNLVPSDAGGPTGLSETPAPPKAAPAARAAKK